MRNFIKYSLLRHIIFSTTGVFLSHTAFPSDLTIREKDGETLRIGSHKNLKVRPRATLNLGSFLVDPSEIQGSLRIRGGKAKLKNVRMKGDLPTKNKIKLTQEGSLNLSDKCHVKGKITAEHSSITLDKQSGSDFISLSHNSDAKFYTGSHVHNLIMKNSKAFFSNKSMAGNIAMEDSDITFCDNSYNYNSLNMKNSNLSLTNGSTIEQLIMDHSTATCSRGSHIVSYETIVRNSSHLIVNNADSEHSCFFQSIALSSNSRISFTGPQKDQNSKFHQVQSKGIIVQSPEVEIAWIINPQAEKKDLKNPYFSNLQVICCESNHNYKAVLCFITGYEDQSKTVDFSTFFSTSDSCKKFEVPLVQFEKGSHLPFSFALEFLTNYYEDPFTHAISYNSTVLGFNHPICDNQGNWYKFGYRISTDSSVLYLTLKKTKHPISFLEKLKQI